MELWSRAGESTLAGYGTTSDGERFIQADSVDPSSSPVEMLGPWGMPNKIVGGGNLAYDPATGAGQIGVTNGAGTNNIGLLVRTTGVFTYVDDHTFIVDDGSGAPITCVMPSTMLADPTWQYVAVTGISSMSNSGGTYSSLLRVTSVDPVVSQPSAGLTGRWEWTSTSGDPCGVYGMLLVQQGSSVSGSVRGIPLSNVSFSGNVLTATFQVGQNSVTSSLTLNGNTLSGTWGDAGGQFSFPVTLQKISSDPTSPYTGRPHVLAASFDGSSIDVTWDRPINGWDYDIVDDNGWSVVNDWSGAGNSYNPDTHVFHMPVQTTPLVPGAHYTVYLDSGDSVDWFDPYGVPAWDSVSACYTFGYTAPASDNVLGISDTEYQALIALYNSTNGPGWTSNDNWLTDNPNWYGVDVEGGRVAALYLGNNQLSGTIPSELGNLTNLWYLDLSSNQLSGPIPSVLGNLTGLQDLYLEYNNLSGPIPAELGDITGLQYLWLSSNDLVGEVPSSMVNLTNLVPGGSSVSYNGLFSTDAAVQTYMATNFLAWEETQTVTPTGINASGATLSWTPIPYTSDPGYYEVGVSQTSGGPYTFSPQNQTASKSDSGLTVTGLAPGTNYLVVQTVTPANWDNQNTVTSLPSSEVQVIAVSSKSCADGSSIALENLIVTAVFPDCFYAENANRAWGIRVRAIPEPWSRATASTLAVPSRRLRMASAALK